MGREHIRAILTLDQAAVIGLYDPDPRSIARANAEFLARAVPEPITYPDLDALANDPAVDAILICSPNFTHRTVFDQLKHSAKAIFLEKPMATTLDDALYLAEAKSTAILRPFKWVCSTASNPNTNWLCQRLVEATWEPFI